MLREVAGVASDVEGLTRRWFSSRDMDLFIWLDADGQLAAFQWSWGKPTDEHVVAWDARQPQRLATGQLDDGEHGGLGHKASPLLRTGEAPNPATRLKEFDRAAVDLPPDLRRRIRSMLVSASEP